MIADPCTLFATSATDSYGTGKCAETSWWTWQSGAPNVGLERAPRPVPPMRAVLLLGFALGVDALTARPHVLASARPRISRGALNRLIAREAPVSVAVIGGGLGGLTAAIALRRVGVDAHVYERAKEMKFTVGTGLTLWPNGLNALTAIDPALKPLIEEAGAATKSIEVTTADGLTKLPNPTGDPTRFPAEYGQPMLNIHWARLQSLLASRLPPECLHLDCSFVGLDKTANGGVALQFERQSGEAHAPVAADVAIGADGINSAVRGMLVGDGAPRDAGRTIWRSIIPFDEELLEPAGCTMSAGAGKVGFLTHLGTAGLYWSAFATDEALAASTVERDAHADVKEYLLEEFSDGPRVLARTRTHTHVFT